MSSRCEVESVYHVEERCISEEGSSPEYAAMDVGFNICGRGSSYADDRLHDSIKKQAIRPANSKEVVGSADEAAGRL